MPDRVVKNRLNKWGRAAKTTDITRWPLGSPYFAREVPAQLRVDLYRDWIAKNDSIWAIAARARLPRLRGRDLACTCPIDQPCHGDVLIELANAPVPVGR